MTTTARKHTSLTSLLATATPGDTYTESTTSNHVLSTFVFAERNDITTDNGNIRPGGNIIRVTTAHDGSRARGYTHETTVMVVAINGSGTSISTRVAHGAPRAHIYKAATERFAQKRLTAAHRAGMAAYRAAVGTSALTTSGIPTV